jgi:PadR family transcriptional regulator, regulatory protein PadR
MATKELVAATTRPLVLSILRQADSYGYDIIRQVKSLSESELNWTDGMLYPVLHRMEKEGLIRSYWNTADTGRRRKYYTVEKAGLTQLEEEKRQWRAVNGALFRLWEKEYV